MAGPVINHYPRVQIIPIIPKSELNNDEGNLLAPFSYGWRRELVHRRIQSKVSADVYYYTPEGRKLRSMREISIYLRRDVFGLTRNNFSFKKCILFQNNVREVSRTARQMKKCSENDDGMDDESDTDESDYVLSSDTESEEESQPKSGSDFSKSDYSDTDNEGLKPGSQEYIDYMNSFEIRLHYIP